MHMSQGCYRHSRLSNSLWIARKRAGYPLKGVARLLGGRSLSVISEYERGRKVPSLRTALKLEALYQTPLAQLFPGLYGTLSQEIAARKVGLPPFRGCPEVSTPQG